MGPKTHVTIFYWFENCTFLSKSKDFDNFLRKALYKTYTNNPHFIFNRLIHHWDTIILPCHIVRHLLWQFQEHFKTCKLVTWLSQGCHKVVVRLFSNLVATIMVFFNDNVAKSLYCYPSWFSYFCIHFLLDKCLTFIHLLFFQIRERPGIPTNGD